MTCGSIIITWSRSLAARTCTKIIKGGLVAENMAYRDAELLVTTTTTWVSEAPVYSTGSDVLDEVLGI